MEKTVTVTITVDPHEEMFSVEGLDGESGDTWEFGPTTLWSDWKDALKDKVNDIMNLLEDDDDDEELLEELQAPKKKFFGLFG